jgi:hypothetical protein
VAPPRIGVPAAPFSGRVAVQIGDVFLGEDVAELGIHRFLLARRFGDASKLGVRHFAAIGQLSYLAP